MHMFDDNKVILLKIGIICRGVSKDFVCECSNVAFFRRLNWTYGTIFSLNIFKFQSGLKWRHCDFNLRLMKNDALPTKEYHVFIDIQLSNETIDHDIKQARANNGTIEGNNGTIRPLSMFPASPNN